MMMKKGNNKGFSLIEIVIGIGMLAVIVVPILHTFITSAQLNRDSRQVMIQTEVAQTIMEGFAGKTFIDVKSSISDLNNNSEGAISGNSALSTIDDNWFNTAGVYRSGYDFNGIENNLTAASCNSVIWQGVSIDTRDLVGDNSVIASMNQVFAADCAAVFQSVKGGSGEEARILTSCMPGSGEALFIGYGNIHYGGYRFDAVVSFLPMAKKADDIYYTYRILLTLYEYKPEMNVVDRCTHVLMTMDGGIMAGR